MIKQTLGPFAAKTHGFRQGRIEPPKAARGHATYIDGKMLSVTKYRIQIWTVLAREP